MKTSTGKTRPVTDDYFELIKRFPLRPIRSRTQLAVAHEIIDELSIIGEDDLTAGQMDYLLVLGDLAAKFEDEQELPISGLEMLKHLIEANSLTASDIGRIIGQRELGSKLVRGLRRISRSHAKLLGEHFGLAPEMFLRE